MYLTLSKYYFWLTLVFFALFQLLILCCYDWLLIITLPKYYFWLTLVFFALFQLLILCCYDWLLIITLPKYYFWLILVFSALFQLLILCCYERLKIIVFYFLLFIIFACRLLGFITVNREQNSSSYTCHVFESNTPASEVSWIYHLQHFIIKHYSFMTKFGFFV